MSSVCVRELLMYFFLFRSLLYKIYCNKNKTCIRISVIYIINHFEFLKSIYIKLNFKFNCLIVYKKLNV